jgi:Ca-activated chloride channel homolog
VEAPPVNLSLVIDRSGSMQGEKLGYVKQAAAEFVRRLRPVDTLSIVTYDDRIEVPVPPGAVTHSEPILRAIESITSRGMTNLSGGWQTGCDLVGEFAQDNRVNRVILLSDGLANRGVTGPDSLRQMARALRLKGITTTTMGVGMGFNEDLMRGMAIEGGGAFYFIDHPDQAPELFHQELSDLRQAVGQNLTLTLTAGDAVHSLGQLNDYPLENRSGSQVYTLGDIFASEARTQVFELEITPSGKGPLQLAAVQARCRSLTAGQPEELNCVAEASLHVLPAAKLGKITPDKTVLAAALFQKAARAREKAVSLADSRDFKAAAGVLHAAAQEILDSGLQEDLLLAEYRRLREEAARMEFGEQTYNTHMRKMHSSQSHQSRRGAHYAVQSASAYNRFLDKEASIERRGATPTRMLLNGKEIPLAAGTLSIGSDSGCGLVLQGPEVGPQHCTLTVAPDGWTLFPGDREYRIHANGGHISQPFRLSAGDVVRVVDALLEFK